MSVEKAQKELIQEFSGLDDWLELYQHIIAHGEKLPELPPEKRNQDTQVKGCQSNVWLEPNYQDGQIYFRAYSDAKIVRGIIALILRVVNNQTPEDILNNELYFIEEIGLKQNLSPSRANGLYAVLNDIRCHCREG